METVKKRPSLRRVLAGYLVLTGGLCLLAAVLWWTGLSFLMRAGVIQPANQMAETAYQAKTAVEAAGTLPPDRLPAGCRYLLLGPEGQTLSTNLTGSRLEAARERRSKAGPFSPYRLRLLEVPQTDGSVYRFQYDYAVHYTDPALDEALPDFQICWLLAGVGDSGPHRPVHHPAHRPAAAGGRGFAGRRCGPDRGPGSGGAALRRSAGAGIRAGPGHHAGAAAGTGRQSGRPVGGPTAAGTSC